MPDKIIDFLNGFNAQTIVSMIIIVWYFTSSIKKELHIENTQQTERIDKLYEMYCEMKKEISDIYKEWNKEKK